MVINIKNISQTGTYILICALLLVIQMPHISAGENPRGFFEYNTPVTIEFKDREDAEKAMLSILPLPENKKVAFSTRWDDTNVKHVQMAAALHAAGGFKGTFYLNRPDTKPDFAKECLPALLKDGHVIGNHTTDHVFLWEVVPNRTFDEIMTNRIRWEALSNQSIVAFTHPAFCAPFSFDRGMPERVGEALLRSGHLASPEWTAEYMKPYNLDSDCYFSGSLFSMGDSEADISQFSNCLSAILKKPLPDGIVHPVMGVHVLIKDGAGFLRVQEALRAYSNDNTWWLCNENEYAAYRYQALHSKFIDKSISGNKATFIIKRPFPFELGADVPLWVRITPDPAGDSETIAIPHLESVPLKIDFVDNSRNEPFDVSASNAKKFPGISAWLYFNQTGLLEFTVVNHSAKPLDGAILITRLPLMYKAGVIRNEIAPIGPGETRTERITLGEVQCACYYRQGVTPYVNEFNFKIDGIRQRIWTRTIKKYEPYIQDGTPRHCVLFSGPFLDSEITDTMMSEASKPTATMQKDSEGIKDSRFCWHKGSEPWWYVPVFIQNPNSDEWRKCIKLAEELRDRKIQEGISTNKMLYVLAAITVTSESNGVYYVYASKGNRRSVYMNGAVLNFPDSGLSRVSVDIKKGDSRVVACYRLEEWKKMMAVAAGDDACDCLPCK